MEIFETPIGVGLPDTVLSQGEISNIVARAFQQLEIDGAKVLLIVPDNTRTAPVGPIFRCIHNCVHKRVQQIDVMIALGTHQPLNDEQINARLEITSQERTGVFRAVQIFNHAWDDTNQLQTIGTIGRAEIARLSENQLSMDVDVQINRRVLDYDLIVIVGPVFPHEVVGFSGGNKYLFPGVGGPDILNFFHWMSALITNAKIIGHKWTPVREVIDRAADFLNVPKLAFCAVVEGTDLRGLYAGTPRAAWSPAADLSAHVNVITKPRAFKTVLSCAPPMYEDLWTGGKCMYKLEPVVADDGELIIYAPHITQVSVTHGHLIEQIGYHTRDYFTSQWDKFSHLPWGVLAHSTHVRGIGTMENGIEKPRIKVTLASQISPEMCAQINLGYRDPHTINVESFANREDEGVLLVRKAGERLYRLNEPQ